MQINKRGNYTKHYVQRNEKEAKCNEMRQLVEDVCIVQLYWPLKIKTKCSIVTVTFF